MSSAPPASFTIGTGRRARALLWSSALLGVAAVCAAQSPAADSAARHRELGFALEPGDVVEANVWREKDLSGDFQVDETGNLTLPMLGTASVTGRPWTAVRDSLLHEYGLQLRNPSVTLTPKRRVEVLGEVPRPGQYLADPTLSLAGVIALAGGATANGDLGHVRVVRGGKVIIRAARIDTLLTVGVHSNDQVFVDPRPWIERNGAFVASAVISTAGIIIALLHP